MENGLEGAMLDVGDLAGGCCCKAWTKGVAVGAEIHVNLVVPGEVGPTGLGVGMAQRGGS